MSISKRLVLFVQGYDPREAVEIRDDFAEQHRLSCELYGLSGSVGNAKPDPKRPVATWDVTTEGRGWRVMTECQVLGFDDIVRADLARPIWWKVVQLYRTVGVAIFYGAFRRIVTANWRFGLASLIPLLLMSFLIWLGAFIGVLCMTLVTNLGAPDLVGRVVGVVTGVGGFASLLMLSEPLTGLLTACDEAATVSQIVNRKRKDIIARLDRMADAVSDAVGKSNADEVVIVGHGLGAALAIEVAGRALTRNLTLGHEGPPIALLTLGASLPVIGFDPAAAWFRNRLRQLATQSEIAWVDVQSPDDALNFCPYDPIAGNGIVLEQDERRNPFVVALRFRDLWKSDQNTLRRWSFRTIHGQYLRANERKGSAYDYTMICCGPLDLVSRANDPAGATAAVS